MLQSLRDVSTAFGVSEDTARKRVDSAPERLAEFFRQRGFKTASVAGVAAALEHAATTASAAVAGTVVSAALQAAPPALAGYTAGSEHLIALRADGTLWAWGYNRHGQLGIGTFSTNDPPGIATPQQVGTDTNRGPPP